MKSLFSTNATAHPTAIRYALRWLIHQGDSVSWDSLVAAVHPLGQQAESPTMLKDSMGIAATLGLVSRQEGVLDISPDSREALDGAVDDAAHFAGLLLSRLGRLAGDHASDPVDLARALTWFAFRDPLGPLPVSSRWAEVRDEATSRGSGIMNEVQYRAALRWASALGVLMPTPGGKGFLVNPARALGNLLTFGFVSNEGTGAEFCADLSDKVPMFAGPLLVKLVSPAATDLPPLAPSVVLALSILRDDGQASIDEAQDAAGTVRVGFGSTTLSLGYLRWVSEAAA